MFRIRVKANIESDDRVKHVNDLVSGIRLLKACAWEYIYFDFLKNMRFRETSLNKRKMVISAWLMLISYFARYFPMFFSVALFTIGHPLRLDNSALILCVVFFPTYMSEFFFVFTLIVTVLVDTWQSLQRIQNFLLYSETMEIGSEQSAGIESGMTGSEVTIMKKPQNDGNALTLNDARFI